MTDYSSLTNEELVKLVQSNPEIMGMIRIIAANGIGLVAQETNRAHLHQTDWMLDKVMTGELDQLSTVRGILFGFIALLAHSPIFQEMFEKASLIPEHETMIAKIRSESDARIQMFEHMLEKAGIDIIPVPGLKGSGTAVALKPEDVPKVNSILEKMHSLDDQKMN